MRARASRSATRPPPTARPLARLSKWADAFTEMDKNDDNAQTIRKRRRSSLVKLQAMGLVQKYTAGG